MEKHPKVVANEINRQRRAEDRAAIEKQTQEIVARHGLRFMHVRDHAVVPTGNGFDIFEMPRGGMTIAYATKHKNGKVIKVATALCNPLDAFCKRDGRNRAAAAFDRGEAILLHKAQDYGVAEFLKMTFDPIGYADS